MELTNDDVEEIIRMLDSSFYGEIYIKTKGFDLYLRRSQPGWTQEWRTLTAPNVTEGVEARKAPESDASVSPVHANEDTPDIMAIRAPMPGIFYRAPKPGAPPFVEIGSEVTGHSVIGIIETMKLMNSISSGIPGTIEEICVANGELVQPQQVLMRVRRAAA